MMVSHELRQNILVQNHNVPTAGARGNQPNNGSRQIELLVALYMGGYRGGLRVVMFGMSTNEIR